MQACIAIIFIFYLSSMCITIKNKLKFKVTLMINHGKFKNIFYNIILWLCLRGFVKNYLALFRYKKSMNLKQLFIWFDIYSLTSCQNREENRNKIKFVSICMCVLQYRMQPSLCNTSRWVNQQICLIGNNWPIYTAAACSMIYHL